MDTRKPSFASTREITRNVLQRMIHEREVALHNLRAAHTIGTPRLAADIALTEIEISRLQRIQTRERRRDAALRRATLSIILGWPTA